MAPDIQIDGVVVIPLKGLRDGRGSLMELFRRDTLPPGLDPAMGYISYTRPGVARGPHEHLQQTDLFAYVDGSFEITLWENRIGLAGQKAVLHAGADSPIALVVPPGVVHAYKNIGDRDAFVLNFPDRLYAGWERKEAVDEIRYEEGDSRFQL